MHLNSKTYIINNKESSMKQILWFIKTYVTLVILFILQKPLFLILEKSAATEHIDSVWNNVLPVIGHGLTLDLSMAAYLTVIPGLLFIAAIWIRKEIVRPVLNFYFGIIAFTISACFILDVSLYPYWGFPLDSTPIYYFFTSPADAFASVSIWVSLLALVVLVMIAIVVWFALRVPAPKKRRFTRIEHHRGRFSLILLVLTLLLFLPIRGGITVSTTNTGKAYFNQISFFNHAAVNPMFSLFESLAHQNDFGQQYRYMDEKEADKIFKTMVSTSDQNTYPILNPAVFQKGTLDILIVIMEGFASDLLPSMGSQKDVAVNLDSIANSSILFTRFYANSFRTDRGLVSILSGYPAQPTTSIMRYPAKSSHLASFARTLYNSKKYQNAYYYGGDVDFANQRSYLVSQGFQKIVSDSDFPIEDKLSKWGVPDHIVANRLLADLKKTSKHPMLRVFQTSSSHEPFDVPYNRLTDKRLNSFAYTDSVIGSLLREYKKLPRWKNTLVVLVPDHVGAYKEHLDNFDRSRYQIPLILTGGAIARPMKINILGSQQDIAATLLGQLGIEHKDFLFSKNMLSDATPKFAFFTVPDAFGVVSEENSLIFDNKTKKAVYNKGSHLDYNAKRGQAYLQKLYDDINKK